MARKFALGLFLLFAGISIVFALKSDRDVTTSSDQAYGLYEKGMLAVDDFRLREACEYFEQAIEEDTNFAMALATLAGCYSGLGYYEKAKETFGRALTLRDKVSERERLLLDLGEAETAGNDSLLREIAEQYLALYPDYKEGYQMLAYAYAKDGDIEKGIEYYHKLLEVKPDYPLAHNMLGYWNYYLGRSDEALAHLQTYLELAPDQANPHDSRGEILHAMGRYDEAIAEFREAFNIQPDFHFAIQHMARSYRALGKMNKVDYCYRTLIEEVTNDQRREEYTVMWAMARARTQEFEEAEVMLEGLLDSENTALAAARNLAFVQYLQHNVVGFEKTVQIIEKLRVKWLEKEPDHKDKEGYGKPGDWELATAADLKGDLDQAAEHFAGIIEKTNMPAEKIGVRYFYADVLWRADKKDLAKSELQKNLSSNPNHAPTLALLADILDSEADYQSARSYRERAHEIWKNADPDFKPLLELKEKLRTPIATR